MPLQTEEMLTKLVTATEDARAVIREAHEAQQALRSAIKDSKKVIADAITKAVEDEVGAIADDAKREIVVKCEKVVDQIAVDLRARLHL